MLARTLNYLFPPAIQLSRLSINDFDQYFQENDINYSHAINNYLQNVRLKKSDLTPTDKEYLYVAFKFLHFLKSKYELSHLSFLMEGPVSNTGKFDLETVELNIIINDLNHRDSKIANLNSDEAITYLESLPNSGKAWRPTIGMETFLERRISVNYEDIKKETFSLDIENPSHKQSVNPKNI